MPIPLPLITLVLLALSTSSRATSTPAIPLASKSRYSSGNTLGKGPETAYSVPEGCLVSQFQLISRHGTRNPTVDSIDAFQNLSRLLSTVRRVNVDLLDASVASKYDFLWNWKNPYVPEEQGSLTEMGRIDMKGLAQRSLKRYPDLLSSDWRPEAVLVSSTNVSRTKESAKAFVEGLWPTTPDRVRIGVKPQNQDFELRGFENCPAFMCPECSKTPRQGRENLGDSNEEPKEVTEFKRIHYTKIADRLNTLFFPGLMTSPLPPLFAWTSTIVDTAMQLCAYQLALLESPESIPTSRTYEWCSLFFDADLELFDYAGDLQMYYTFSYGRGDIARQVSCKLLTNITDTLFDRKIKAHLRFSHAETLLPLITSLNFFKEPDELKPEWTLLQRQNRVFRTSAIVPFGGNFAVERIDCTALPESPPSRSLAPTTHIRLFVHETPVVLPGCSLDGLCPLSTWVSLVGEFMSCPWDKVCRVPCPARLKQDQLSTSTSFLNSVVRFFVQNMK